MNAPTRNARRTYEGSISHVSFGEEQIATAVARLAEAVAADFRGQPLLVVGVLKGALYVTVDLVRALSRVADGPSHVELDFVALSSYGNAVHSSGEVRLLKDVGREVSGKNVLVVEDILDRGLTLQYLRALLQRRGPARLRSCVLFDKPYGRRAEVSAEYVGLVVPDRFVVGYGLDYAENFRNLPYLAEVEPWVIAK